MMIIPLTVSECLASLSFQEINVRKSQVPPAADGTTSWIWNHPVYLRFATENSGILWVRGKPGSGKSVLARSIQRRLLEASCTTELSANPTLVGDWFYHRRRGGDYIRHESFVRSVLFHFLDQRSVLFDQIFRDTYRSMNPREVAPWTYDILVNILKAICQSKVRVICIIDAVDEAESTEVISLIQSLIAPDGRSNAKFIVLSRPNVQIERRIEARPTIVVEDENAADIKRIIDLGLSSLQKALHSLDFLKSQSSRRLKGISTRSNMRQPRFHLSTTTAGREKHAISEIRETLVSKSQGSILWVKLLLDKLIHEAENNEGSTIEEMRQIVNRVPDELSDYYRQISEELTNQKSPERVHEIRQVLMWICSAPEIGDVTLDGVWEALAVLKDDMRSDKLEDIWQKQIFVNSYDELWRKISSVCGPFIEIFNPGLSAEESRIDHYGPSSIIQLMHQSVREFLCDQRTTHNLSFTVEEARQLVRNRLEHYLRLTISDYHSLRLERYQDPQLVVNWLDDQKLLRLAIVADKTRLETTLKDLRATREWVLEAAPQATPEQIFVNAVRDYSRLTLETQVEIEDDILAIGRLFYHCCTKGYTTAIRNILALEWVTPEEAASTLGDVVMCSIVLVASISGSERVNVELDLYANNAAVDTLHSDRLRPVTLPTWGAKPFISSLLRHCMSSADLPLGVSFENQHHNIEELHAYSYNTGSITEIHDETHDPPFEGRETLDLGLEAVSSSNQFQGYQHKALTNQFHREDDNVKENTYQPAIDDDDDTEADRLRYELANSNTALSDYFQSSKPTDSTSQTEYSGQNRDDGVSDTSSISEPVLLPKERILQRRRQASTTETIVDEPSATQEVEERPDSPLGPENKYQSNWVTHPWTVVLKIDMGGLPQERRITFKQWFPFLDVVCGSKQFQVERKDELVDESDQEEESMIAHIEDIEDAIIASMGIY